MRGEGWLYGLAFLGLLGAGAALIGPRLAGGPGRGRAPSGDRPERTPVPARAVEPLRPAPEPAQAPARRVRVIVSGEAGALRGPLKPVVGARTVSSLPEAAGGIALVLEPGEGEVAFGASGHRWVRVAPETLADGERVALPAAAPPVVVKVREQDGSPAEDVPVEVRPASPGAARRTDAGGTLVLDDLDPGLCVVLVGGVERFAAPQRLLAGEDRELRVVLEPAWSVSGRVLDADGQPLPGARVEGVGPSGVWGRAARADAAGRFTWLGPAVSTLALMATAPGLARVAVEVSPPAGGALASDVGALRLSGADVQVTGRVKGGERRAGAEVVVEPQVAALLRELFGPEAVLDLPVVAPLSPEGTFDVRGLPGGVPLRLALRGAGLPEDALLVPRAGDRLVRDFEPLAGERLEAEVLDEVLGQPAAGLTVLLSREPREGDVEQPDDLRARTDATGRFRVDGLLPGPIYLRGTRPGRRSLLRRVDLPAPGTVALRLTAALTDDGRRVSGSVVDETGAPLEGVTLRAAGVRGLSAADGTFRLEGVESLSPSVALFAAYDLGSARRPGGDPRRYGGVARAEVVPGGPPVRLVLPRDQTVTMRLIDGLTDEPLTFVWVVARTDDGRVQVDRGAALVDGRLELPGLPRLPLALSLFAPGRRLERTLPVEALTAAAVDARRTRDLGELRLLRGLSIAGAVRDARGAPLAGARVAALDPGWLTTLRRDPAPRRELLLRVARTDADGRYRLEGLDPLKPAAIVAWAPGHAPTLRRAVFQRPPGAAGQDVPSLAVRALARLEAVADVRLRAGSRLSLLLSDASSREPVRGAVVDLESARNGSDYLDLVVRGVLGGQAGSSEEWVAASEHLLFEGREAGAYTIGPIEPGEYELVVEHPLFLPERRRIPVLDPGDPFSFEALELEPGAGSDPNDPALARRLRRGPEMVSVYGSDKMRLPLELTPR